MLIDPPVKDLLDTVDCRYTLVVETAKRARQIIGGDEVLTENVHLKPVSTAVQEIYEGQVSWERREGLK